LLPPQTQKTIGDTLSAKGISWAWYGGSWNAAVKDGMQAPSAKRMVIYNSAPGAPYFVPHHQPFNYFANFAPGTAERERHLKDYDDLIAAIDKGDLPAVAFYKPQGTLNQHPGSYADIETGDATSPSSSSASARARCGSRRRSSSPTTRTAASGTTSRRRKGIAGVRARAFRRSSCRRSRSAATWTTRPTIRRRSSSSSRAALTWSRDARTGAGDLTGAFAF